jgi:hypothetical protein
MRIKLYLDEDVPFAFAQALLNRGVDVITTQEVRNDSLSDAEQLDYAVEKRRTLFTHNKKDFIVLHNGYLQNQEEHSGIILSDQLPIGTILRRFMKLWFSVDDENMKNRVEFLSNWK